MGIRSVSSRVRLKELCSEAFFFAATEEKLRVVPVGLWFLMLGCVEFGFFPDNWIPGYPKLNEWFYLNGGHQKE